MANLDRIDWEILNATADDYENLEQIFLAVAFVFEPCPGKPASGHYRRTEPSVRLEEVAERIQALEQAGLLKVAPRDVPEGAQDAVCRSWFTMTDKGRDHWQARQPAAPEGVA